MTLPLCCSIIRKCIKAARAQYLTSRQGYLTSSSLVWTLWWLVSLSLLMLEPITMSDPCSMVELWCKGSTDIVSQWSIWSTTRRILQSNPESLPFYPPLVGVKLQPLGGSFLGKSITKGPPRGHTTSILFACSSVVHITVAKTSPDMPNIKYNCLKSVVTVTKLE